MNLQFRQKVVAFWAVFGVSLLLFQAIFRLTPVAIEPWLQGSLTPMQKGLFVSWMIFNAYMEGYRAFQKRFCPRVVSRAFTMARSTDSTLLQNFLAPVYALGLINKNKKQLISTWVFLIALMGLIFVVRHLQQPWRGIIDGGVVVGLGWGLLFLWILFFRSWFDTKELSKVGLSAPMKT